MAKVAILVVIVLGVLFFVLKGGERPADMNGTTETPTTSAVVTPIMPLTVAMYEQNSSGQAGMVDITSVDSTKIKVVVTMTGTKSTVAQPAHIHVGMCPNPGAVKYPLTDVVNGSSETVLDVTLESLLAQGDLAINVHKSAKESSVYVSCGDIK